MQQAADVGIESGRKITVIGRSMRKNLNIARNLGYVDIPEHEIVTPADAASLPPTASSRSAPGARGADVRAHAHRLRRPSGTRRTGRHGDHLREAGPGNELRVHDSINQLARAGAEVLHEEIAPVHVSGHACQEELRTMLSLLRPRYVMPIHGEYRMQAAHAKLAREAGVPEDRIILGENGSVVELARGGARLVDRVDAGITFVDGLRVGEVQDVALRDRRRLADDGVLIVITTSSSANGGEIALPELIARGVGESEELLGELRDEADRVVRELVSEHLTEIKLLQEHIHDAIGQIVYDRTSAADGASRRHRGVGAWPAGTASSR